MRTKDAILNDAGISSIGMMSELELEILIDIRDQLLSLAIGVSQVVSTLTSSKTLREGNNV